MFTFQGADLNGRESSEEAEAPVPQSLDMQKRNCAESAQEVHVRPHFVCEEHTFSQYVWAHTNKYFQLVNSDGLTIGGGSDYAIHIVRSHTHTHVHTHIHTRMPKCTSNSAMSSFTMSQDQDLKYGITGTCSTFSSPPLCSHKRFVCERVEVWTFTRAE